MSQIYAAPLDAMLALGDDNIYEGEWYDYRMQLSLTAEHIPELIRMMTDQELWDIDSDVACWAPPHAWRALAQLKALEAVEPMFALLEQDGMADWFTNEAPMGLALMGAEVLPILEEKLKDGQMGMWGRIVAYEAMALLVTKDASLRDRIIPNLITYLEDESEPEEFVVSALIIDLIKLQAVEAAPVIEAAFASGRVDELLVGTWPRVQIDLGLKQRSDFTEAELESEKMREFRQTLQGWEEDPAIAQQLPLVLPEWDDSARFGQLDLGLQGVPMQPKQGFKSGGSSPKAKGQKKKKKKK